MGGVGIIVESWATPDPEIKSFSASVRDDKGDYVRVKSVVKSYAGPSSGNACGMRLGRLLLELRFALITS